MSGLIDGTGVSKLVCMTKWKRLQQHSEMVQHGSITRVATFNSEW